MNSTAALASEELYHVQINGRRTHAVHSDSNRTVCGKPIVAADEYVPELATCKRCRHHEMKVSKAQCEMMGLS